MDQKSAEWYEARCGKLTGSRFAALMSTGKGREDLIRDLAWERYTGKCIEGFASAPMLRGIELEPEARDWYVFVSGNRVLEEGFIEHSGIANVGISPDGLVGDDGLIEIKCPMHRAHIETVERRKLPSQYRWQVQGQLWVTGRKWLDFISYHPDHDGVIIRVDPSESDHAKLAESCIAANEEIESIVSLLKARGGQQDG